jgi:heme-degrading monooxygenase HmoA
MNTNSEYFAVIFTSRMSDSTEGYSEMSEKMVELAKKQEGFLGIDSARSDIGITVSYWESLESIKNWKMNAEHTIARNLGREQWYKSYDLKICKVVRAYNFKRED